MCWLFCAAILEKPCDSQDFMLSLLYFLCFVGEVWELGFREGYFTLESFEMPKKVVATHRKNKSSA
jgi:hypothetical protein